MRACLTALPAEVVGELRSTTFSKKTFQRRIHLALFSGQPWRKPDLVSIEGNRFVTTVARSTDMLGRIAEVLSASSTSSSVPAAVLHVYAVSPQQTMDQCIDLECCLGLRTASTIYVFALPGPEQAENRAAYDAQDGRCLRGPLAVMVAQTAIFWADDEAEDQLAAAQEDSDVDTRLDLTDPLELAYFASLPIPESGLRALQFALPLRLEHLHTCFL